MGWSKTLKANRELRFSDIDEVINNLPEYLKGWGGPRKQTWGWAAATDIDNPEGKVLGIRGAYYSEQIATTMARALAKGLRALGYEIKVGRTI